ncbi:MAG: flagellar hook-associated protein FlgL [Halopseudomonas sp.]|uniref:flagellar hook-associated protein FlgL n=1 Tax=Halopseudomonas sp. TaxID=2901191 RepID=UPI0030012E7B
MRISTIQQFNTGVRGIQDNYAQASRTQEQINSGKRILSPADDPVATVRLLQLSQEANKLEQYKTNMTAATNSLAQEEAVLNSVNNVLQRVREITLEAGGGALSDQDRQALATELEQREGELLDLFNSRNARGEYLFGGYQSKEAPFVQNSDGSYSYQGDEGQRSVQIAGSKTVALNDNGKELFVNIANVNRVVTSTAEAPEPTNTGTGRISLGVVENKTVYDDQFYPQGSVDIVIGADAESYEIVDSTGNPLVPPVTGALERNDSGSYDIRYAGVRVTLDGEPAAGDSFTIANGGSENRETRGILDSISTLRKTLESPGDSTDAKLERRDVLAVTLDNLDNAMNSVLQVQTTIGARMNVIDSTQVQNDELSLINTTVTSELEDLDYAEALSRLSLQTVVLEAAQQSFVKVSGLSLFNLI